MKNEADSFTDFSEPKIEVLVQNQIIAPAPLAKDSMEEEKEKEVIINYCYNCGEKLIEKSTYCHKCGSKVR